MKESTKQDLDDYAQKGIPVGGFLEAVLCHDLFEAFARADEQNSRDMQEIVSYIYNYLPSGCHGNAEKVNRWLMRWEGCDEL